MVREALCIIAPQQTMTQIPINSKEDRCLYIHTMKYYIAIERTIATCENMMFNERSQR